MKTKSTRPLTTTALAALLVGTGPALFADMTRDNRDAATARGQSDNLYSSDRADRSDRLNTRSAAQGQHGQKVSDLLGRDVHGSDEQKLGTLNDLVVDTRSGKITHAVVASGGILGFGANLRAVPIDAVRHGEDRFHVNVSESRWEQAPVITREQLLNLNQENRIQELASFYGEQQPGQQSQSGLPQASDRASPGQIALASDIRGKDVRQGDQKIGSIDDLIVRFESRSVSALFDAETDFAGSDQEFLVPLARFQNFGSDDGLTAQLSRDDFTRATPMSGDAMGGAGADQSTAIYVWPGAAAGGVAVTDRTLDRGYDDGPRVGARTDESPRVGTRADQNANQAPLDEIRRAVQAEAQQAGSAVRVSLEDNKIVLRGTVPSDDIKERIENRAENAARGWDVENEIRVNKPDKQR
jgi:sporulation protein YlmC with PRC-barrel domain